MLIYRVEHEGYGHGPYVIDQSRYRCECDQQDPYLACCALNEYYWEIRDFADLLCGEHSNDEHPTPRSIPYWKVCGFESIEALRSWFDGFEDMLDHHGYVIATYTYAETVMADDYGQVTFEKDAANCLTTERI